MARTETLKYRVDEKEKIELLEILTRINTQRVKEGFDPLDMSKFLRHIARLGRQIVEATLKPSSI